MTKLMTAVLGVAMAVAAAAPQTYTGVITDTMCGKDHSSMGVKPDSKCVVECVRAGAKYALYDGKTVYLLSDQKAPEKFAGQRVTVKGEYSEKTKTLTVTSIAAAGR